MPEGERNDDDERSPYTLLSRRYRLKLWWWRRAKTWSSGLAVLVVGVLVVVCISLLPRLNVRHVSGAVKCESGAAVTGIWVHDSAGGGYWAPFRSEEPDTPSMVIFRYDNLRGEQYSLSVGCGGTPGRWGVQADSVEVAGASNSFVCYDLPTAPARCLLQP
jgi:hypothetical protein